MPGTRSTSKRVRLATVLSVLLAAIGVGAGPVVAATGPYQVKDIYPGDSSFPEQIVEMGGIAYFVAFGTRGQELYRSDGTESGTHRVKDIRPGNGSSYPGGLTAINGLLYFSANNGTGKGHELFRSDGTKAGTYPLADINPGPASSSPGYFTGFNGYVYFSADDGSSGRELWRTNGMLGGTSRFKDIAPGPDSSSPASMVAFAGKLVFTIYKANDGFNTLYRSNGTWAGTKPFRDSDGDLIVSESLHTLRVIGGRLYFSGSVPEVLWRSNGTSASTKVIASVGPSDTTGVGSTAFFTVGDEIWRSDGTVASTTMVKEIAGASLFGLTAAGGQLFFVAEDSSTRLYVSDGSGPGTVEVDPADDPLLLGRTPVMAALGTILYFTGRDQGLAAGASAARGVGGAPGGGCPAEEFTLWRSNGTPAGTFEVSPTPDDCVMDLLTPVAGSLYFVSDDGANNRELWRYVP